VRRVFKPFCQGLDLGSAPPQITAEWNFDPDFITEVEVTFTAQGPKQTLVRFEHRNLDRFGEVAAETAKQMGAQGGWPATIENFGRAAEDPADGLHRWFASANRWPLLHCHFARL
jgi:hypothetical protein